MLRQLRNGWAASSALVAMIWVGIGGPTAVQAAENTRPLRERQEAFARNLHLPLSFVQNPRGYLEEQARLAEERRKRVVADMRQRLAVPPERLEAHADRVQEVYEAHAPYALPNIDGELTKLFRAYSNLKARNLSESQQLHRVRQVAMHKRMLIDGIDDFERVWSLLRSNIQRHQLGARALSRHDALYRSLKPKLQRLRRGLLRVDVPREPTAKDLRRLRDTLQTDRNRLRTLAVRLGWKAPDGTGDARMPFDPLPHTQTEPRPGPLPRQANLGGRAPSGVSPLTTGALSWVGGLLADLGLRLPFFDMGPAVLSDTPVATDTAATTAAPTDGDIGALATSLQNDPVKIFHYVQGQIDSEIYYGSLKGAEGTLAEKAGNDFDQANLLVALLRAAGHPARYEYGTVRVPAEIAKELAGVDDDRSMSQVYGSQGIPARMLLAPNSTKAEYLEMEHIWVRAHVPDRDYRGHDLHGGGGKRWVALDPFFKRYQVEPGEHFRATLDESEFNVSYFDSYIRYHEPEPQPTPTATPSATPSPTPTPQDPVKRHCDDKDTPVSCWFDLIRYSLTQENPPRECDTPVTLSRSRRIKPEAAELLPARPPFEIIEQKAIFADYAPSYGYLEHQVEVAVFDESRKEHVTHTASMASLYSSTLGVAYPAATQADQDTIDGYPGGIFEVPLHLVDLKPAIYIDGVEIAAGDAVPAGIVQHIDVRLIYPDATGSGATSMVISHRTPRAGGTYSVLLGPGKVPSDLVADHIGRLSALTPTEPDWKRDLQKGHNVGLRYFQQITEQMDDITAVSAYAWTHDTFEGLGGRRVGVVPSVFGNPLELEDYGYFLDMKLTGLHVHPVDGDRSFDPQLAQMFGYEASTYEHVAIEQATGGIAMSTIKALREVAKPGGPELRAMTASDVESVFAILNFLDTVNLSADAEADIERYARMGRFGYVPTSDLTFEGWTGAGYLLLYGVSKWGCYLLSGSLAGSQAGGHQCNGGGGAAGANNSSCSGCTANVGSTVNLSAGSYFFGETDLVVPAPGMPAVFARTYRSDVTEDGPLGVGWSFSLGDSLTGNGDGSFTWRDESGRKFVFTPDGQGGFNRPDRLYATLAHVGSGAHQLLLFRSGITRDFNASGQLAVVEDRNGNKLTLTYGGTGGTLSAVHDRNSRQVLSFGSTDGVHLDTVTDVPGSRTVTLTYDGTKLTTVNGVRTDVTDERTYTYDTASGLLITKAGPVAGELWQVHYDGRGWLSHTVDPLGHVRRATYDPTNSRATFTNTLGHSTYYEYDAGGHPTLVEDPLGNITTAKWDADGNKLETTGARGTQVTMTYDADGNMLTRADTDGTTTYAYNSLNLMTSMTPPPPTPGATPYVTVTNTYDANGNMLSSTDAEGGVTTYDYDIPSEPDTGLPYEIKRKLTATEDATTRLTYSATTGNLEVMRGPLELAPTPTPSPDPVPETVMAYDAAGHTTSVQDPLGNSTTFATDDAGNVTQTTDAASNNTDVEYDAAGRRTKMTQHVGTPPQALATTFDYDAMGRVTSVSDPDGNVTRTEYDSEGRVIAQIDARGARTELVYDPLGRLIETRMPDGGVMSVGYCADQAPNCASCSGGGVTEASCRESVDALGYLTHEDYDDHGRLVSISSPTTGTSTYAYDDHGRRTSQTDAENQTTSYAYDKSGRLTQVTDAESGVTTYGYDLSGRRTQVTDAEGQLTQFKYDAAGRLFEEQRPIDQPGDGTEFIYDAAGNRTKKVTPNDKAASPTDHTAYVYDTLRRMTQIQHPDATVTDFAYDSLGRRTYEKNYAVERDYEYDDLGRLSWKLNKTLNKGLKYSYDASGNRLAMELHEDGNPATAPDLVTRYTYDSVGRMKTITAPDGGVFEYSYDLNGQRIALRYPNSITTYYLYEAPGRLSHITYLRDDGTPIDGFEYEMDATGNRTAKTQDSWGREAYGYDKLQRLTSASYPNGRHVTYEYDGVGNRTRMTERASQDAPTQVTQYCYNEFNQLLCYGPTAWADMDTDADGDCDENDTGTCDDSRNVKQEYDPNGNMIRETRWVEQTCGTEEAPDTDCDTVPDAIDNCPGVHNPDQTDSETGLNPPVIQGDHHWTFEAPSGTAVVDEGSEAFVGATLEHTAERVADGRYGQGLLVNERSSTEAKSDLVRVPYTAGMFTEDFTIAMWVKFNRAPGNVEFLASTRSDAFPAYEEGFYLVRHTSGHIEFAVDRNDDSYTSSDWIDSTTEPAAGEWHHIAAVFGGGQQQLYVDGVMEASQAASGAGHLAHSNDLTIGGEDRQNNDPGGHYTDASIDEVAVFRRALSAAEVVQLEGEPYTGDGVGDVCDVCPSTYGQLCGGACVDVDGDGFGVSGSGGCERRGLDCDDNDNHRNPAQAELNSNGVDDDCDGRVDEVVEALLEIAGGERPLSVTEKVGSESITVLMHKDPAGVTVRQEEAGGGDRKFLIGGPSKVASYSEAGAGGDASYYLADDEFGGLLETSADQGGTLKYWTDIGHERGRLDASASRLVFPEQRLGVWGAEVEVEDKSEASELHYKGAAAVGGIAGALFDNQLRLYSPASGSFLSVDPVGPGTLSPSLSLTKSRASLNSYAAFLGAPVRYGDATGAFWQLLFGLGVAGAIEAMLKAMAAATALFAGMALADALADSAAQSIYSNSGEGDAPGGRVLGPQTNPQLLVVNACDVATPSGPGRDPKDVCAALAEFIKEAAIKAANELEHEYGISRREASTIRNMARREEIEIYANCMRRVRRGHPPSTDHYIGNAIRSRVDDDLVMLLFEEKLGEFLGFWF